MAHSQRWLVGLGAVACAVGVAVALSPSVLAPGLASASHMPAATATTPVRASQEAGMTQAVVKEANGLSLSTSRARDATDN